GPDARWARCAPGSRPPSVRNRARRTPPARTARAPGAARRPNAAPSWNGSHAGTRPRRPHPPHRAARPGPSRAALPRHPPTAPPSPTSPRTPTSDATCGRWRRRSRRTTTRPARRTGRTPPPTPPRGGPGSPAAETADPVHHRVLHRGLALDPGLLGESRRTALLELGHRAVEHAAQHGIGDDQPQGRQAEQDAERGHAEATPPQRPD